MLSTIAALGNFRGAVLLVMIIAGAVAVVAVLRKQLGAAVLLLGAAVAAAVHVRSQSLLGIVTVVVGGAVLTSAAGALPRKLTEISRGASVTIGATIVAIMLAYIRLAFLSESGVALFAFGLSPELPERASAFIERENIPAQILSVNFGAYFTWRLFPKYLDFYDSRTIPFGKDGFDRIQYLASAAPGPGLDREADRYGINAVLAPLGPDSHFKLRQFCDSDEWPPVYLDEVSAVFVRRRPENEELIERLRIRCDDVLLPTSAPSVDAWQAAALALQGLGRYDEALVAIRKALEITPGSAFAHVVAGELYQATRHQSEAEQEYRSANALRPDSGNWLGLAGVYLRQGRTADEIDAPHHSIDLAWGIGPILQLQLLGDAEMRAGHPQEALRAVDRAIALLPPPAPPLFAQAREAILRAIEKAHRAPLPGGFASGLRR